MFFSLTNILLLHKIPKNSMGRRHISEIFKKFKRGTFKYHNSECISHFKISTIHWYMYQCSWYSSLSVNSNWKIWQFNLYDLLLNQPLPWERRKRSCDYRNKPRTCSSWPLTLYLRSRPRTSCPQCNPRSTTVLGNCVNKQ